MREEVGPDGRALREKTGSVKKSGRQGVYEKMKDQELRHKKSNRIGHGEGEMVRGMEKREGHDTKVSRHKKVLHRKTYLILISFPLVRKPILFRNLQKTLFFIDFFCCHRAVVKKERSTIKKTHANTV